MLKLLIGNYHRKDNKLSTELLKELDVMVETIRRWSENPKLDDEGSNKYLYNIKPQQWLLLSNSLILHSMTEDSKIPSEIRKSFRQNSIFFNCDSELERAKPEFLKSFFDNAVKYWLPLSHNLKLGYMMLSDIMGIKCASNVFINEGKIAKNFFQGVTYRYFNEEKFKVYKENMATIIIALPLFLKYPNGFLRLLMACDYLNAVIKQNLNIYNNECEWSDFINCNYKNLVYCMELGKVIAVQDLIHADFGCRQSCSTSLTDELDIIEGYRIFFQQAAEQGGYATNHAIPYDKQVLTEFFEYPKSIRNSLLASKMFEK